MIFRSWITRLPAQYITKLVTFQCVAANRRPGTLLIKFRKFIRAQISSAIESAANNYRNQFNITILNTIHCEVHPVLANIKKPMFSYTKVSWVRGPISLRKLRL